MRSMIRQMVADIAPLDPVEAEHRADVLAWIDGGHEIFRTAKPATPPKHLVSYCLLVDSVADQALLVDHRDAQFDSQFDPHLPSVGREAAYASGVILSFTNMETRGRWQALWDRNKRGIVPLLIGVVCLVFAVGGLAEAVFSDTLVAGPDFVVSSPSVEPGAVGITTITPIALDAAGLRVGWAIGSSLILGGLAVLSFAAARVVNRSSKVSPFSSTMSEMVEITAVAALLMIGVGMVLRLFLEGRIATELGVSNSGLSPDDDYNLWVFDIPFLPLLILATAIGWIWKRGRELQSNVDGIV